MLKDEAVDLTGGGDHGCAGVGVGGVGDGGPRDPAAG